jgi:F-type H+-transporting ATPase subunit b
MNENIGPLSLNVPLIITQIVGFGLLLWFLNQYVFKSIFAILDQRQADIKATYDQLDADRARMEETRRQYEQRLANIEAEAREKIQAAVQEAQALRDNLVADARQQAETIVTQGRNEAERERQAAFLAMRQQIVAIAMSAAGKVVGENLSDARQTKMVDDFIGNVGLGAVSESGRGVSGNTIGSGSGNGAASY